MTTNDANDRYTNSFEVGEDGWGSEQDGNLNRLEREVPEDKTLANRPAADAEQSPNWLYATDDDGGRGTLYRNRGTGWDRFGISGEAVQAAWDGHVVAVAPGVGMAAGIDIDSSPTPIQDAVDVIESVGQSADGRYGAGTVLLPPGQVDTPGGIAGLAGKTIQGFGLQSTIVNCTDLSTTCFALGGDGSNMHFATLRNFCISGDDRTNRTAGSAISGSDTSSNSLTVNMINSGLVLDRLLFKNWGGPDPVIEGTLGFSNRCGYLMSLEYDGSFYVGAGFDFDMGWINCNHSDFDTPVVDLQDPAGAVYIRSLNVGGNVGQNLRYAPPYSRFASLHVGHINTEPDSSSGGTLTSAPAPVNILGSTPVTIGSISQQTRTTSDYIVSLGATPDGGPNSGPGHTRIGGITYGDAASVNVVGLTAAHNAPNWYWGPASEIDYGGFSTSGIIPLADVTTA